MDKDTGEYSDSTELTLIEEENGTDFSKTFCKQPEDSELEFGRICSPPGCDICNGKTELGLHFSPRIVHMEEIEGLARISDPCQLFYIGRKHSFARLNVSRELFEELSYVYSIFTRIWDYVLPFGFKTRESDMGQAPFKLRQLEPTFVAERGLGSFECAYGFRYPKLHGRFSALCDNPENDPWSIRQLAVYQQYNSRYERVTLVIVAPSDELRGSLEQEVLHVKRNCKRLNAFGLHLIILLTLHENWRLYIRSLEIILRQQSDRVTLTRVQNEAERLSNSTDLSVEFMDRQRFKAIEDKILDLVIVFKSLCDTILKLKVQCRKHCAGNICVDCTCPTIVEEFEDLENDVRLNLERTDLLYKRAQGSTQLLSDLLDYENAQIALMNEKSLNGLVKEAKIENSKMMILAERSTRDAAAVRILTVITLIYLPMTVVASFFSSQLIQVDENGQVSVVSGAWWFAAVSIPMTVATFLIWKYWLSHSLKQHDCQNFNNAIAENPVSHYQPWSYGKKWSATTASKLMHAISNRGRKQNGENGHGA